MPFKDAETRREYARKHWAVAKYTQRLNEKIGGSTREHILIAEKVLGGKLPKGALVHHVDLDGTNNSHLNLVICPSQTYHMILHQRTRALDACGHVDWLRCAYCKEWDSQDNLKSYTQQDCKTPTAYHPACARARYKKKGRGLQK